MRQLPLFDTDIACNITNRIIKYFVSFQIKGN